MGYSCSVHYYAMYFGHLKSTLVGGLTMGSGYRGDRRARIMDSGCRVTGG